MFTKLFLIFHRNFATLYFIMVIDEGECELATLDLIQVFVKALNSCFENVCELDIIFNFDKVSPTKRAIRIQLRFDRCFSVYPLDVLTVVSKDTLSVVVLVSDFSV